MSYDSVCKIFTLYSAPVIVTVDKLGKTLVITLCFCNHR